MLVFYKGTWHTVALPDYIDPSWTFTQRMHAAYLVLKGLPWNQIESELYTLSL
jgi:hypothetical protein